MNKYINSCMYAGLYYTWFPWPMKFQMNNFLLQYHLKQISVDTLYIQKIVLQPRLLQMCVRMSYIGRICCNLNLTVCEVVLFRNCIIKRLLCNSNRIPVQVDSSNNDSNAYNSQTDSNDCTDQVHCNRFNNFTIRSTLECDHNVMQPHYKVVCDLSATDPDIVRQHVRMYVGNASMNVRISVYMYEHN